MRVVQFTYKNVMRRPMRSSLTVSGVAVAVGAVVALVGISGSFERELLAIFQSRGVDLVVTGTGGLQTVHNVIDEKLVDEVQKMPGVREVSGSLFEQFSYPDLDLFGVTARGTTYDSFLLKDLKIVAGRGLAADDGRVVVLGKKLSESLRKHVGDSMDVDKGETFKVIGIFDTPNVWESGTMMMPLTELQRMMDREGKVTLMMVVTDKRDKATIDDVRSRIQALSPRIEVSPAQEYVEQTVELRLARAMAWMTSALALIVGTIGMINTMLTAVFERTRELAVLRAVGWRKWSVVRLILLESVLLGLAGAVVGTLLAMGLIRVLSLMPASGRLVAGDIGWGVIGQGFALALIVGVAGGLYPAYRAARLIPTEGLRHE